MVQSKVLVVRLKKNSSLFLYSHPRLAVWEMMYQLIYIVVKVSTYCRLLNCVDINSWKIATFTLMFMIFAMYVLTVLMIACHPF